jgi:hypothetical protein
VSTLQPLQFMPVVDLMNMHSAEALRADRQRAAGRPNDPWPEHSVKTRFRNHDLFVRKASEMDSNTHYHELDEPIRKGTIDPVMIQPNRQSNVDEIYEGHHRIVRAHQLGVQQLPVTRGGVDTQKHYNDWDAD